MLAIRDPVNRAKLSIPLNGFSTFNSKDARVLAAFMYLSIPLNGFLTSLRTLTKPGTTTGSLSIPLNGFKKVDISRIARQILEASFNSIEWIPSPLSGCSASRLIPFSFQFH